MTHLGSLARRAHYAVVLVLALWLCAMAVAPARAAITTLHDFSNPAVDYPDPTMILASDGNFYGTVEEGGDAGVGYIYRMTATGTFTILHHFTGGDGARPFGFIQASDGNFYGATDEGGNGWNPTMGQMGYGIVFKMTLGGQFSVMHAFNGTNGQEPSGFYEGSDGYLYGICEGTLAKPTMDVVFRISKAGVFQSIFQFSGTNGYDVGGLLQAPDGHIYGVTIHGGNGYVANSPSSVGLGTIFRLTTSGVLTTLHKFSGTDGSWPLYLLRASDGHLYGTTAQGGNGYNPATFQFGHGTIFRMTTAGVFTSLYKLNFADGSGPGYMHQAADGHLYGVAGGGGNTTATYPSGFGTLFRFTLAGAFTRLHAFRGVDGMGPGLLLPASDGTYYGTTGSGGHLFNPADDGAWGAGTLFRFTTGGVVTSLHSFGGTDGAMPMNLMLRNGVLHGLTGEGGSTWDPANYTQGGGVAFRYAAAAPVIASFTPVSGPVGTSVSIVGRDFVNVQSVTFNGKAATFTVNSAGQIVATVPAGATTGVIRVITALGTAVSARNFTVTVPATRWNARDITQASDGSTRILMSNGTAYRIQKWTGTMQLGTSYTPSAGWTAVGIAANSAGGSFLLWKNGTTSYQIWIMDANGARSTALAVQRAGGWTATDVSAAGDGSVRVLLVSPTNQMKVVRISGSTATAGPVYTPASGWTAAGIATGVDNKTRLLWRNGTTSYQLWTLNANCALEAAQPARASGGWTAREVSLAGDGSVRVLLVSPTGQIRVNNINGSTLVQGTIYTPASGYTPVGISADRDTSGRTRLLWQHSGGALNLWTLGANGALQNSAALGTY